MLSRSDFLKYLIGILEDHRDFLHITKGEIVMNLQKQIPRREWTEEDLNYVINRFRKGIDVGRKVLQSDEFKAFMWSYEISPYEVTRKMERRIAGKGKKKRIIPFRRESFHAGHIDHVVDHTIRYLPDFLDVSSIDVFLQTLERGEATGIHHRRRDHYEVVWCVEGVVEMEFEVSGPEPERVLLKKGHCVVYDASLPHVTKEKSGEKDACICCVSIKVGNHREDDNVK